MFIHMKCVWKNKKVIQFLNDQNTLTGDLKIRKDINYKCIK